MSALPLQAGAPNRAADHVVLTRDALEITHLRVGDPQVVAAAQAAADRGQDLAEWTGAALRCGATALGAAAPSAETAALRGTVQTLEAQIRCTVDESLGRLELAVRGAVDPDEGALALASQAAVTRLAQGIQALITGPDAAVPARVQQSVSGVLDQAKAEIGRALAAQSAALQQAVARDRETGQAAILQALGPQLAALQQQMTALRAAAEVTQAVHAERSLGHVKGTRYELDVCAQALADVAARAGDGGVQHIGRTNAADGSRKGDVLVEFTSLGLDPAPRLVVEAKATLRGLSATDWRRELEAARRARRADVALGLCSDLASMPVPGQPLVVLDDRSLVLAFPDGGEHLLVAAYLMLRLLARAHRAAERRAPGVDTAAAQRVLAGLRADIESISAMDGAVTSAGRQLETIRTKATDLRRNLGERIEAMSAALLPEDRDG